VYVEVMIYRCDDNLTISIVLLCTYIDTVLFIWDYLGCWCICMWLFSES